MNEGPERIDYQETSDVTEVHAAIKREHAEPRADVTPIPLWLTAVCGLAVCWAGAYLGAFHGGFSPNIFNEYHSTPAALFPLPQKEGKKDAGAVAVSLAAQGKAVYANCQACHGAAGAGQPGIIPPLAKAEWVTGGEKRLIAILLKGVQGPFTVAGKAYTGAMPAWEGSLTDKKIAAVASYIRAEWGNNAPEISEAKVTVARKEFENQKQPWTEPQLLQIPPDANFDEVAAVPSASASATAAPAAATTAGVASAPPAAAPPGGVAPVAASPAPPAPAGNATSAPPSAAPAQADPAVLAEGKKNYMTVCVACHQPTGLGLPMVFPPLAKTEYVTGSPERFAAMILKGNAGPMTVDGKPYNNVMPGQEAMLDDAKVASIMTYVRASFGNNAPPVSAEVVARVRQKYADRKTPWTEAELKAWQD